jgi:hypothetical protein
MRMAIPKAMAMLALSLAASPALASFAVPPNAPGQYAPRDECSAQEGGVEFLAALKSAVSRRDAEAFADLTSPEIFLDFGGGGGREAVLEMLGRDSEKWKELDKILPLGCAWDGDNSALVLPWFFNQDLGDADPYSTMVTLGSDVPLMTRPSRRGRVQKVLNWQLIHVYEVEVDDPGYRTVAVIDSNYEGYIRIAKLRAQLDYRLRAEKQGGRWLITSFIAGD